MTHTQCDPNHFYQFDFDTGIIQTRFANRAFVLPEDSFFSILSSLPPSHAAEIAKKIGQQLGKQFQKNYPEILEQSVENSVQIINGFLALHGLGTMHFERWGDALTFQVESLPEEQTSKKNIRYILDAFLGTAFDQPIVCVPVDQKRFFVAHQSIASQIKHWSQQGFSWGQILDHLAPQE